LGIDLALLQIHPPVTLVTASVPIQRNVIYLDARLLNQTYAPIVRWVGVWAVVVPGLLNRDRCSGMLVRKSFFTATAPNAQGFAARSNEETWDYFKFACRMTGTDRWIWFVLRIFKALTAVCSFVRSLSDLFGPGCIGRHNSKAYRRDTQFGVWRMYV
jgi:hypothetical protein